jgi:hypothetical protein
MSKTFCCEYCEYVSTRLYNLQRHVILKHTRVETHTNSNDSNNSLDGSNVNLDGSNVNLDGSNVNLDGSNVNLDGSNVNLDGSNVNSCEASLLKCPTCYKTFSYDQTLKRHIRNGKCKRVSSTLECEKCHIVFSCISAKSRHRKVCKGLTTITLSVAPCFLEIKSQVYQCTKNKISTLK